MNLQELMMKELLLKEQNQLLAEIHRKVTEKKIMFMISSDDELLR